MRKYAQSCLSTVKKSLLDEFSFLLHQLDSLQKKEVEKTKTIEHLESTIIKQTEEFLALKTWARWDEIAHDEYVKELRAYGITKDQMKMIEGDMEYAMKLAGSKKEYIKDLM